jgi:hypothetical protein
MAELIPAFGYALGIYCLYKAWTVVVGRPSLSQTSRVGYGTDKRLLDKKMESGEAKEVVLKLPGNKYIVNVAGADFVVDADFLSQKEGTD